MAGLNKKNVTPLLKHWKYVFLTVIHRYIGIKCWRNAVQAASGRWMGDGEILMQIWFVAFNIKQMDCRQIWNMTYDLKATRPSRFFFHVNNK